MDIIKIIQETATWIEKVNNDFTTNLFRTEKLSPHHYYHEIPGPEKLQAISRLISMRSALLNESGVELIPVAELHHYGRIMIFDPNSTVVDGAPEAEAAGFIDIGDAPPWDTWVAIGQQLNGVAFYKPGHEIKSDFLIGWVPKSHYFYADCAVQVACVDNFKWPSNEFIANSYHSIKELFCKPIITKTEPPLFYADKINKVRMIVLQELELNSKLYYRNFNAR